MITAQSRLDPLYACFDFHLRSEIPLSEMAPALPDDGARAVVTVSLGDVPADLPGADRPGYGLQVSGDQVLLTIAGTARFLISDGSTIVVAPEDGASDRNVRLFLLGSALGILCHQRGLLLLHANAIVVEGRAVAFSGQSGAGKSTLAAYFQSAGYDVLCDDVCGISFNADGVPMAWPGLPRLKLWGEAAVAFGYERTALDRAIEGKDKYHVPLTVRPAAHAVPFDRLYLLERAAAGQPSSIERLRGSAAMNAVSSNTYRGQYLADMGLGARHFTQCALLLRHAGVFAATRQWGYDVFDEEAARFERHVRDDA